MNQQDFVAISIVEKCDISRIQKCDWCNVWKPNVNMRGRIFGTVMCDNCQYNFMKMTMDKELAQALLLFCQRRLNGNAVKS